MAEAATKKIGDWTIQRTIGQGAMGIVYLVSSAHAPKAALKVFAGDKAADPMQVERFKREIRQVIQLDHPNIVGGLDAGVHDGSPFVVMEYVDGPEASQVLEKQGALDEKTALRLLSDIARAPVYATDLGLVHRDIKPDNIMITSQGVGKLCDLGLAKSADSTSNLTLAGTILGTPSTCRPSRRWAIPTSTSAPTSSRSAARSITCWSATRRSRASSRFR
jgi:serine/threonine-protein kinase